MEMAKVLHTRLCHTSKGVIIDGLELFVFDLVQVLTEYLIVSVRSGLVIDRLTAG